jgi:plasmid stabilization system protein ParE
MSQTALPYKIILLNSFENELAEITDYLTENVSHKVAQQLIEVIDSQLDIISTLPYIYPAYAPAPRFRKMPIHNWQYVAFYTITKQKRRIGMVHICHTARDIHSVMREKKYF